MNKEEAKKRIEKLKKVINYHRYLYHVLDKQEISQEVLDSLKKELFDLEQKFPDLITSDSPTQRVGGKPLKEFQKVRHPQRMLSFNDAFSKEDLEEWLERVSKLLTEKERKEIDFYCELKIDGLAVELIYENGIFKVGSTRGDGIIGEDVTQNLKTIEAIPLSIEYKGPLVVRGEVFITKKEFERINQLQKEKGLSPYANPRNVAAGSVRQLDPKITASRKLDSFMYDLKTDLGQRTHEEIHQKLREFGFKTNPHNKYCKTLEEVLEFREYWRKKRETLDYEIDGIVVIINNIRIFEKLGAVGKAPRGAIAFKFPPQETTSKVLDVKFQVGRTGSITPVAVLEPVQVGGVIITRATLHNEDEIKRLGVKIGDTVVVGRAGDVIPDIVKVLPELRTGKEKKIKMPQFCPACKSKLVKKEGESVWRCPNERCFARQRRNLYHFVSKAAFDIKGLGPKIIDKLLEEGLIQDPADIFDLKEGDLIPLERFAEKSAKNLINSIQSRREIDLARFIYSLGIRNVGEETAFDLAKYFGSLKKLKSSTFADLDKIPNIGEVVAKSIYEWFHDKKNLEYLEKLEKKVKIKEFKTKVSQKLKDKIFVFTGGLESLTREEASQKVRELGGEVSSSVSSKTDYVVVGSEPGSKFEKAKKLGAKIISEKEFLEMIKND